MSTPRPPASRRAAIAVWQDRVAPVFDVARHLVIVEADGGAVTVGGPLELPVTSPAGRALRLAELGVHDLVCGAISRPLAWLVGAQGIRLIPFVTGPLDEVVPAWLRDGLAGERFAMPGCCGRPRARGRRAAAQAAKEATMGMRGGGGGMGRGGGGGGAGGGGRGGGRGGGGRGLGRGGGRGRMGGPRAGGPGGQCVCPQCGQEFAHAPGEPCAGRTCPQCGIALQRK